MKIKKNGKIIKLTESDLKRITKMVITEQDWKSKVRELLDAKIDYKTIENLKDPLVIYGIINDSLSWTGDDEAVVEAAFMAIEKGGMRLYRAVDYAYRRHNDSYPVLSSILEYVEDYMDIRKTYHRKSILKMASENGWS